VERDKGATVVFKDVCVTLGKKDILNNVYGMAKVGQMLAIMGPSGILTISMNIHINNVNEYIINIYHTNILSDTVDVLVR